MANVNSDIIQAYVDEKRIRTMNYHGTVTTTTCVVDGGSWVRAANNIAYITLAPFGAILGSVKILYRDATTAGGLVYNVGVAGINPNGSFTSICELMTVNAKARAANTVENLVDGTNAGVMWSSTLYQLINTRATADPAIKAVFEQYKDKPLCVLFLRTTTLESTDVRVVINLEWVDPNPSSSPLISTAFKAAV